MVCQNVWTRVASWSHDWMYLDSIFYIQVWAECFPALSHMMLSFCVVPASHYFTVYRRRRLHSALWWRKAPSSTCLLMAVCALFINARSRLMSFSVLKIWSNRAGAFVSDNNVWPTLNPHSGNNGENGSEAVLVLVWVLLIDSGLLTEPSSTVLAVL